MIIETILKFLLKRVFQYHTTNRNKFQIDLWIKYVNKQTNHENNEWNFRKICYKFKIKNCFLNIIDSPSSKENNNNKNNNNKENIKEMFDTYDLKFKMYVWLNIIEKKN